MTASRIERERNGDTLTLKVIGNIGENSEIFNLASFKDPGIKKVIIDFKELGYINSVGIKNWVVWTRRVPTGVEYSFTHCPSAIVNQMSSVVDFLPEWADVDSLYVPFYCDECSSEHLELMEKGKNYEFAKGDAPYQINIPSEIPCPECNEPMEMDAMESRYFAFLKKERKKPNE